MDASVVEREFALAVERQRQGDLGGAERVYREILTAAPDHAGSIHNLGVILYQRGCLEEAVAAYHRALDVAPDFVEAYNNLGLALDVITSYSIHYTKLYERNSRSAFECHFRYLAGSYKISRHRI